MMALQRRTLQNWVVLLSLVSLLCAFSIPVHAGGGVWTQGAGLSGYGSDINALAIDPSGSVYAGTWGGIFKSSNGGASWAAANSGLPDTMVTALVIDSSGSIYAGTNSGVFKSSNGGTSWMAANSGLISTTLIVKTFAIDPSGSIYVGTGGGVFKSNNGGASWLAVNSGFPKFTFVSRLVIDRNGILYAGTNNGGVFTSSNGGSSWAAVNSGMTSTTLSVNALAIDLNGSVYAATNGGVFKSSNGGISWSSIWNNYAVVALAIDQDGSVYAGTNGGGVVKSSDGGASWTAVNYGLTNGIVYSLAIDTNGSVYVGTGGSGVVQYTPVTSSSVPFRITGAAWGGNDALSLSANITVASSDAGKTGNLYIVAALPNGVYYALSNQGWAPLNALAIQHYATATFGTHTVLILNGTTDVTPLKGALFIAGYGTDANDLLSNRKYAVIYTVQ